MRLIGTQPRPGGGRRTRALCIAGLVGLYSILGAIGIPPASAQEPQPTPLVLPTISTPIPSAIPSAIPTSIPTSIPTPPSMSAPPGACACDRALYTCSDFSNWSAAQACFNQCRLTAGYDIHGLDEDGDGVACEMAMEGPSPFTLPVLPTPIPSPTPTLPLAQDTVTAARPPLPPALPTPSIPVATAVVTTVTPLTSITATVTELPAYPAETVAGAEDLPAQSQTWMRALPWAVMIVVVAVAAGVLVWLRRRS